MNKGIVWLLATALLGACAAENESGEPSVRHSSSSAGSSGSSATAGTASVAGSAGVTAGSGGSGTVGGGGSGGSTGGSAGSAGSFGGTVVQGGSAGQVVSGSCATTQQADGSVPLIDDLNHAGRSIPANELRSGVWDVWTKSASADMSPASSMFEPEGVSDGDGFVHWTGNAVGGVDDWGPTMTVQLSAGCPYDASVYTGIGFKLKGSFSKESTSGTTTGQLKVMFWQPQGVPLTDAVGGKCSAVACYNHYSTFVTIPSAWDTPVNVTFASLTQGTWTGTVPFVWNPAELIAIQFQLEVNGTLSELATFDISIDDLTFTP